MSKQQSNINTTKISPDIASRQRATSQKIVPQLPIQPAVQSRANNNYSKVPITNYILNQRQQKKRIYKVNCRQTLILRPNGNVVIQNFKDNKYFPLNSKIYLNDPNFLQITCEKSITSQQAFYEGGISAATFLPVGQGKIKSQDEKFTGFFQDGLVEGLCRLKKKGKQVTITCEYQSGHKHGKYEQSNSMSKTSGYYENNLKQGLFEVTLSNGSIVSQQYFINNQLTNPYDFKPQKNTTRYLFSHQDFSINNYSFKGLDEGMWLNQLTVDYYLELLHDYYRQLNGGRILLINTVQSQDIFSSQITTIQKSEIQLTNKQKQQLAQINNYDKIIFVLNVDRSHFLVLVYQNFTLYLLNSLSYYLDDVVLEQVSSVFQGSLIKNKQKFSIPQQQNGYDCGIHSIYNTWLQYKWPKKLASEIHYTVEKDTIKKFRNHVKNVLIGDFAHLGKI